MTQLRLFNTLAHKKQIFQPLKKNTAKVYSCGPTVYGPPHIGNLRAFLFADTLRRSLEFFDFKVQHVMNITDVGHLTSDGDGGEDKLETGSKRLFFKCKKCDKESPLPIAMTEEAFKTGNIINCVGNCAHCGFKNTVNSVGGMGNVAWGKKTVWEVAALYEQEFRAALKELNIKTPSKLPRATDHIPEQIALIKQLTKKGFAYETSDGIYFDTAKFKTYGKLGGQKIEEKVAGARVAVKSEKRNPTDFALWKFCVGENANHTMRWDFATGKDLSKNSQLTTHNSQLVGFPGWHLECSAMSLKYLAPEIFKNKFSQLATRNSQLVDIHTGGVDHIPVHHENEIAQSEAATGRKFVNFWLHNEFLTVDGGKMSKSLGNLFTLADLQKKGFEPLAFRYLCLGTHYRQKLNFTWEALRGAANSLTKLREIFEKLPAAKIGCAEAEKKFTVAIADDLNTPRALAVAREVARDSALPPAAKRAALEKFDQVLGLDLGRTQAKIILTAAQKKLLDERKTARAEKDFAKSDAIRAKFEKMGFEIKDADNEQIIRRK